MNTLIIGPSNTGKTSFIACVEHAANVLNFHHREKEKSCVIFARNTETQSLFSRSLDILHNGLISIPGTSTSILYDFSMEFTKEASSWWKRLFSSSYQGRFLFMDGPGGSIFSNDINKEKNRNFQMLLGHLKTAQGLLICIDSIEIMNDSNKKLLHVHYKDNIQYLLTHSYSLEIPFQKVSFVFTKADLYAKMKGHEKDAELFLQQEDPFQLVLDTIGIDVFRTIVAFSSSPNTLFQFSFSSVYGFVHGAVHQKLERLNAADWRPYNVIENFAFLLTGEKEHPAQHLYSIQEIEKSI